MTDSTSASASASRKYPGHKRPADFVEKSEQLVDRESVLLGLPRTDQQGKNSLPRTGVALSGGGIRSAIVSIGALQALAALNLLKDFDMISGVSGGGYAASALQWWWSERRRKEQTGKKSEEDNFGTGPANFPYGTRHPNPQKAGIGQETTLQGEVLAFLRWHGSYLIPGDGITVTSGIAVVLRTLFLNLIVWLPLTVLAFILINWAGYLSCAIPVPALWPPLGNFIPLMECMDVPYAPERQLVSKILQAPLDFHPHDLASALDLGPFFSCAIWLAYLIVAALAVIAVAMALLSHRSYDVQAPPTFRGWLAKSLLFSLLCMISGWLAFFVWWKHADSTSLLVTTFALFIGTVVYSVWSISDGFAFFDGLQKLALNAAYVYRRGFETCAGRLFVPTLAIFLFGTIPIIPYYLHHVGAAKSLSVGLAAATTISGAVSALFGHYAGVQNVIPGLTARIIAAAAAAVFLYLLFVLAYFIAVVFAAHLTDQVPVVAVLCSIVLALAMCLFVNINNISLHRFYRDRLMEAFMPDKESVENETVGYARGADRIVLSDLASRTGKSGASDRVPYLILSANAILVHDTDRKFSSRGGDSFLLSPLYIGSQATGWRLTDEYQKIHGPLTLASAAATSGAAASARAAYVGKGLSRDNLVSVVMTLLNTRLGMWVANPSYMRKKVPGYVNPVLAYGLFGRLLGKGYRAESGFIELSDGGHFENLGLYELARRKTEIILVIDAEEDGRLSFPAFISAIARIRTDFGAVIELEADMGAECLSPDLTLKFPHGAPCSAQPYFVCRIRYENGPVGVIVYMKSALIKDLSMTALGYRSENADFPNQSTLNQFFEPPQFEAYRELGFQSVYIAAQDLNLSETIGCSSCLWQAFINKMAAVKASSAGPTGKTATS